MSKDKKMEGIIKKLLKEKKIGFIKAKDINQDIFFHFNDVKNKEFLKEGAKISFKLEENKRGYTAKEIFILEQEKYVKSNLNNILKNEEISNFNLKLNKYSYAKFIMKDENTIKDIELKLDRIPNLNKFLSEDLYHKFISRYVSAIKNLENNTHIVREKRFKPEYKLIIGLGSPSIYEVSMTLHHIYGIPYIPGQAIKGVLRNYVINAFKCFNLNEEERLEIAKKISNNKELKNFEELGKEERQKVYKETSKEKENKALKDELFKFVFGSQDNQGNIVFFDAFPDGEITIDIDIMNNHFPEYYDKGNPPTDWQKLNPVKFLVVKNTPFRFFIGMKKGINMPPDLKKFGSEELITTKDELINYIFELLKEALEFNGIGARTSIGYGYLSSNQGR
ncbi:type III-B CRISPR module RAMP protein Cmr6 [Persephonella sp.]|uniref:type III-B CRISPR module RAMP protein Cmr6 n=1 Tax=Persephonella sp. TaxID=2060922 RepID=UPI00261E13B0|nr:type III-B CRISPR module RAMP protein Cmr6 [Persephonella sp.]